jgi:hypothetical protein
MIHIHVLLLLLIITNIQTSLFCIPFVSCFMSFYVIVLTLKLASELISLDVYEEELNSIELLLFFLNIHTSHFSFLNNHFNEIIIIIIIIIINIIIITLLICLFTFLH